MTDSTQTIIKEFGHIRSKNKLRFTVAVDALLSKLKSIEIPDFDADVIFKTLGWSWWEDQYHSSMASSLLV